MTEENIKHATNNLLAEWIETYNQWRRGLPPYDEPGCEPPFEPKDLSLILTEAARRLREKPKYFNHEQFNI